MPRPLSARSRRCASTRSGGADVSGRVDEAGGLTAEHRQRIFLVGLTGGIGAGKSTVAALCAEAGAVVVSADELARQVVSPGSPALAKVGALFGSQVISDSGELDRAALAQIVFADDAARAELEDVLHPAIQAAASRAFAAVAPGSLVVYDIPLLTELRAEKDYDAVLVVETPVALRLERLVKRGMTLADARARIEAQASDEERRAIADVVVMNDSSVADLAAQLRPHLETWAEVARSRHGTD